MTSARRDAARGSTAHHFERPEAKPGQNVCTLEVTWMSHKNEFVIEFGKAGRVWNMDPFLVHFIKLNPGKPPGLNAFIVWRLQDKFSAATPIMLYGYKIMVQKSSCLMVINQLYRVG